MNEPFLTVVESKRFLGREFLTWLVHCAEDGGARFDTEADPVEISLGDRVVLAGGTDRSSLAIRGAGDLGPELGAGLRRGKLLDRARLVITRGERRWELTLDGGLLTYDGLHCPPLGERDGEAGRSDPRARFENDLFLRLADVEEAIAILDRLFAEFCRLRASSTWAGHTLPALRSWVDGLR